jgi:WD40 repeat protein/tRNA A-37 threonylcarbamoyl transferase component Bud32
MNDVAKDSDRVSCSSLGHSECVDRVCNLYEDSWLQGKRPDLSSFLGGVEPAEQFELIRELLLIDLHYRRGLGESPTLEEYRARHPAVDFGPCAELFTVAAPAAAASLNDRATQSTPCNSHALNGVALPVGQFGNYELLEEIARGGMGVVFKARQVSLNRIVAVKMILAGLLATKADHDRFHSEAQAAAVLDHPNIVPVFEVGEYNGQHYFSMGYVDGQSLAARLADAPFPPREAAELVTEVARAVEYAHRHGVIHRDIKPSNILIDSAGRPRITDFGLAKRVDSGSDLTATGQVMGTPSYMAPEQAAGQIDTVGPAADVYALGALLYATLTGRPPFQAATSLETLQQVLGREPVALRQINPAIPRDLETIVLKCLEKPIPRRYATAKALADDLRYYFEGRPIMARPVGRLGHAWRWCRRQPVVAGLIVGVALTLVAGIIVSSRFAMIAEAKRINAETQKQRAEAGERLADIRLTQVENEKKEVEAERRKADAAKRQVQRQLALSYINQGTSELEHGDPWQGYAILGQAYRAASDAPDLRAAVRALLGAWDFALPRALRHDGAVTAAIFSPDGTKIATASYDKTVQLWEAATGKPLGSPIKHNAPVRALAFSPDGTKIAAASFDNTVRLRDATTGQPTGPLMRHSDHVNAVAFSPDGTKIATAGKDKISRLWDAATGKPLGPPMMHDKEVWTVAFSPDGAKLATASDDRTARLWDTATGKPLGSPMSHDKEVWSVAFSPDGTKIATGSGDSTMRLWATATGKPLGLRIKQNGPVTAVAFSPDGAKIATASDERSARLWKAATGTSLGPPMKQNGRVYSAAFSPDGTRIVTACDDGSAPLWDEAIGKPLDASITCNGGIFAVAFSPDGTMIATASDDETVRLWDAVTRKPLGPPIKHSGRANSVAFSPDRATIATASSDKTVRLWDVATCKLLGSPMMHNNEVHGVAFSPDGTKIATACYDKTARLWHAATGKPLGSPMMHDNWVNAVAFSPDGTKLATASADGTARLWNAATGKPLGSPMVHNNWVHAVTFSPDGTKIATACFNRAVQLWDAAISKPLGPPIKHNDRATAVAFSPDGKKLATASADGTARLWDVATRKPLGPPMMQHGWVDAVAFSPDGTKLATACVDHTVRLWRVPKSLPDDPAWIDAYVTATSGYKEDIDGTLHPISADVAAATWIEIVNSPSWLEYRSATLDETRRALHEDETLRYEVENNWFAAAFHLRWLAKHDADAVKWQSRLEALEKLCAMAGETPASSSTLPERELLPSLAERLPTARRLCTAWERWGFSPDGARVVFADQSQPGSSKLRIATVATKLTNDLFVDGHDPAWQPAEGRWIAFVRQKGALDPREVWLVPSAGGPPKKLCEGWYPSWSADGKTLYCVSQAPGGVIAVDLETSRRKRLADNSDSYPAISRDGKRIADLKNGLLVIGDIASDETLRVCRQFPGLNAYLPGLSPDGKQVGFSSSGGANQGGLWLLDVESGRKTLIANGPWAMPIWSPDGNKFTFQYRGPGKWSIWIVDAKELAKLKPESVGI